MAYRLAIDIGNSRTKFGLFEGRELMQHKAIDNDVLQKNNQLFSAYELNSIIVSSVNESVESDLDLEHVETKTLYLNHQTNLPIDLDYHSPETLGKDRIANVVAANHLYPTKNNLVIDAGTCITYDFIDNKGRYLGGSISPGVQLRLNAMNNYTDRLPLLNWDRIERPASIGKTTISSMLSGVINGIIAEMDGIIEGYSMQYSGLQIVLTGGDANFFVKEVKNSIFADPNLVLIGLNEILIYNQQ